MAEEAAAQKPRLAGRGPAATRCATGSPASGRESINIRLTPRKSLRIARLICGEDPNPLLFEQAVVIAECEYLLRCVAQERIAVIERLRDPGITPLAQGNNSLALAEERFREGERAYAELVKLYPQVAEQRSRQIPCRAWLQ